MYLLPDQIVFQMRRADNNYEKRKDLGVLKNQSCNWIKKWRSIEDLQMHLTLKPVIHSVLIPT